MTQIVEIPAGPRSGRFEDHIAFEPNTGCWLWMGSMMGNYPRFRGKYAHRLIYEAHFGPIPDGFEVCHKCDVPLCVNIEHLFLGTHKDNMQDMSLKGRSRKGYTQEEKRSWTPEQRAEQSARMKAARREWQKTMWTPERRAKQAEVMARVNRERSV